MRVIHSNHLHWNKWIKVHLWLNQFSANQFFILHNLTQIFQKRFLMTLLQTLLTKGKAGHMNLCRTLRQNMYFLTIHDSTIIIYGPFNYYVTPEDLGMGHFCYKLLQKYRGGGGGWMGHSSFVTYQITFFEMFHFLLLPQGWA